MFEYYRRLAGGWTGGSLQTIAPAEDVVLRAPPGTTTLHTRSGRQHTVNAHGCVTVIMDDAELLVRNGWQRVEQVSEATE